MKGRHMRPMLIASPEAQRYVKIVSRPPVFWALKVRLWLLLLITAALGGIVGHAKGNNFLLFCLSLTIGGVLTALIVWGRILVNGGLEQRMVIGLTDPAVIQSYRDARTRLAKLSQPQKATLEGELFSLAVLAQDVASQLSQLKKTIIAEKQKGTDVTKLENDHAEGAGLKQTHLDAIQKLAA